MRLLTDCRCLQGVIPDSWREEDYIFFNKFIQCDIHGVVLSKVQWRDLLEKIILEFGKYLFNNMRLVESWDKNAHFIVYLDVKYLMIKRNEKIDDILS